MTSVNYKESVKWGQMSVCSLLMKKRIEELYQYIYVTLAFSILILVQAPAYGWVIPTLGAAILVPKICGIIVLYTIKTNSKR